jgi:hypothetical protein
VCDGVSPPPVQGSAYGLTIRSRIDLRVLLSPPHPGLPELTIEHRHELPAEADRLDQTSALLTQRDGRRLAVQRTGGGASATVFGPAPSAEALAHPLLGIAATVVARWRGWEVFHAGSFVCAGGDAAIGVAGTNLAGKSTLLHAIAAHGRAVMADDLLFTDGVRLHAGPRTLDLRSAQHTNAPLRPVRHDRLRATLDPAPQRLPLRGWLQLEWAPRLELEPIAASELLAGLIGRRALRDLASDPQIFLALASLPAWRLRRPQDWSQLDASVELLLATAGA